MSEAQVIIAATTSAVANANCPTFDVVSGTTLLKCSPNLDADKSIALYSYDPTRAVWAAVIEDGAAITLSASNPAVALRFGGPYRVDKPATTSSSGVWIVYQPAV